MELSSEEKWVFMGLICLACKNDNKIPYENKWIERTLNVKNIEIHIQKLTNINLLSTCYQNAIPIREEEIREDKIRIDKITFDFESIYSKYPKRIGRKQAERHFIASVKTEQDYIDIQKALTNYINSGTVAKGFIQNASTWFNNWRDWINYVEPEVQPKLSNAIHAHPDKYKGTF
jgi:hypothetical protein